MTYEVLYGSQAAREVGRLDGDLLRRILKKAEALVEQPRPPGCQKLVGEAGWRVRVGDYRILYEIDDARRRVVLYRVQHRREVYR